MNWKIEKQYQNEFLRLLSVIKSNSFIINSYKEYNEEENGGDKWVCNIIDIQIKDVNILIKRNYLLTGHFLYFIFTVNFNGLSINLRYECDALNYRHDCAKGYPEIKEIYDLIVDKKINSQESELEKLKQNEL